LRRLLAEFEHSDERRTLRQLLTGNFRQINHYKCKKNSLLGNHYHKETFEIFIITKGEIGVTWRRYPDGTYVNTEYKDGDVFIVDPFILHNIRCVTDCEFLTILTKKFDPANPDLHKES